MARNETTGRKLRRGRNDNTFRMISNSKFSENKKKWRQTKNGEIALIFIAKENCLFAVLFQFLSRHIPRMRYTV